MHPNVCLGYCAPPLSTRDDRFAEISTLISILEQAAYDHTRKIDKHSCDPHTAARVGYGSKTFSDKREQVKDHSATTRLISVVDTGLTELRGRSDLLRVLSARWLSYD